MGDLSTQLWIINIVSFENIWFVRSCATLLQFLARALKCRCEKLKKVLSILKCHFLYETKGRSAMGFSGFLLFSDKLCRTAKWRLLWSNPLRSPLRAPMMRPNALLQVAWNGRKVYIIELIDLYLIVVRHPINQGKCNDRREHLENHLASSNWLRLVIAQKNSHSLGHQDLIVPTFPLYAHAKSAVLCHDLPMASKIFSRWMWRLSTCLQPWTGTPPSLNTGGAAANPPAMVWWGCMSPSTSRQAQVIILRAGTRNGNSGRWQILMIFWTLVIFKCSTFINGVVYLPSPFPAILPDFLEA